jgi:hypothetical protein
VATQTMDGNRFQRLNKSYAAGALGTQEVWQAQGSAIDGRLRRMKVEEVPVAFAIEGKDRFLLTLGTRSDAVRGSMVDAEDRIQDLIMGGIYSVLGVYMQGMQKPSVRQFVVERIR